MAFLLKPILSHFDPRKWKRVTAVSVPPLLVLRASHSRIPRSTNLETLSLMCCWHVATGSIASSSSTSASSAPLPCSMGPASTHAVYPCGLFVSALPRNGALVAFLALASLASTSASASASIVCFIGQVCMHACAAQCTCRATDVSYSYRIVLRKAA